LLISSYKHARGDETAISSYHLVKSLKNVQALFEGFSYDEDVQLLISTLMDYALPHSQDVPNITTILVEIPSNLGPFGAKGVGEPPVVPVSAARAFAIYDAVGTRVTHLPITPERLFSAMHTK
jgi:CO/xanthine dehydrogenase Mo-binding subunit